MTGRRHIPLGFSMRGYGYHASAWLDPDVPSDGPMRVGYYRDMAQTAERGLFDLVFMADQTALRLSNTPPGVLGRTPQGAELEPLTLIAALSQHTRHIGLAATASSTFHAPYQLARQFASLDHISGGRVAWNIVTSSRDEEARNFGSDAIMAKDDRYRRAREAIEVVFGLWESWEEDAFPRDKQTGVFFRPDKMHPIAHEGEYFKVHGPLTLERTPQGRPLIIQAGASGDGMDLAASVADLVYAAQNTLPDAKAFTSDIKSRVTARGRDPSAVHVMPGILPIIGSTQDEADALYGRMQEEMDPMIGLENLSPYFGDLSRFPLDGPVPELRTDRPVISRGRYDSRHRPSQRMDHPSNFPIARDRQCASRGDRYPSAGGRRHAGMGGSRGCRRLQRASCKVAQGSCHLRRPCRAGTSAQGCLPDCI